MFIFSFKNIFELLIKFQNKNKFQNYISFSNYQNLNQEESSVELRSLLIIKQTVKMILLKFNLQK